MRPNAQAGDQPVEPFDFHGKPVWRGETVMCLGWWRQRVQNYTGIWAGSGGASATLIPLAPNLFVRLQNLPDAEHGDCTVFCPSLRLGIRMQDLP